MTLSSVKNLFQNTLDLLPEQKGCFAFKESQKEVQPEKKNRLDELPTEVLSFIGLFLAPLSFASFAQMGLKHLREHFLSTSSISGNDGPIIAYINEFLEEKNKPLTHALLSKSYKHYKKVFYSKS